MINDILELKWRLPLPDLLKQTGLGAHAKRSAACPLHEDTTPSFSVFQTTRGWRFKYHAGCGERDEITFLEKWRGLSRGKPSGFTRVSRLLRARGDLTTTRKRPETGRMRPPAVPPPRGQRSV
jgi:hypothetical protein